MKAVAIDQPGGPEALTLRTLPVPKVDANEILIACSSLASQCGTYKSASRWLHQQAKFPYVLGSDGSGVVAAVR